MRAPPPARRPSSTVPLPMSFLNLLWRKFSDPGFAAVRCLRADRYRSVVRCLVLLTVLSVSASAQKPMPPIPVAVDASAGEFCLIVVPDTQRYARYFPNIFLTQFQWIRDSVGPLNVKYVIHVGDVVDDDTEAEWRVADDAFSLIDGVVPYLVVPGNHDIDQVAEHAPDSETPRPRNRSTTRFNALFSPKRFEGRTWYGGHRGVQGDNSFGYFTGGGQRFMVLGLEFGPSDETLAWAGKIADIHDETDQIILVTHCYLLGSDKRVSPGDDFNPHTKFGPAWNDGEDIWQKLVRKSKSIGMVLSGHVCDDGAGMLISNNDNGRPVLQMVANYQFLEQGGQGWLRILKFEPKQKRLEVYTYSPLLKRLRDDPDQRFGVDVPWLFPAPKQQSGGGTTDGRR